MSRNYKHKTTPYNRAASDGSRLFRFSIIGFFLMLFGCKNEPEHLFEKAITNSIWGIKSLNINDTTSINAYAFYTNYRAEMFIKIDSEFVSMINLEGSNNFSWNYSESDSLFVLGGLNTYKVKNVTVDSINLFNIKTQRNEMLYKIPNADIVR